MTRPDAVDGGLTVTVVETTGTSTWRAVTDLGEAGPEEAVYVVDTETATIRFGNGVNGRPLPTGASVEIGYRVGAGAAGIVDTTGASGRIAQIMPAVGWSVVVRAPGAGLAPLVGWALVDPGTVYRDGTDPTPPPTRTVRGLVVGPNGAVALVDEQAPAFGGYRQG